jgi:hypothetical protein
VSSTAAALLADRLGLTDDELLRILDEDPLAVLGGELDHRPELPILLSLTDEAAQRSGEDLLRRWVRVAGRHGIPIELLLARNFIAFEDALDDLRERGFVVRGGGR